MNNIKYYNGTFYYRFNNKYEENEFNEIQLFQNSGGSYAVVFTDGYSWGRYKEFDTESDAESYFLGLCDKNEQDLLNAFNNSK